MNVKRFISKNLVALVMVPVIIGGHYSWYKLQEVDALVSRKERNNIPFFTFFKKLTGGEAD